MKLKKVIFNVLLLIIATTAACFLAEFIFRIIIFSEGNTFSKLKRAEYYTNPEFDEDYYKLRIMWSWNNSKYYRFAQHQYLGWIHDFNPDNYIHADADKINKRRPVLFYGDSFAECVYGVDCFQTLLNNDTAFNRDLYFLNYGVRGYGLDQMYYLMNKTINLYEKPVIVFSFLTIDMQRAILKLRDGIKPYYTLINDSLVYHNENLNMYVDDYINKYPPKVHSYLWKLLLYNEKFYRIFPFLKKARDHHEAQKILQTKKINEVLLQSIIRELKVKKIDFMFVLFCAQSEYLDKNRSFQETLAKKIFDKEKIPYILVRDSISKYALNVEDDYLRFYLYGDGHPTTLQNKIVSDEIKNFILLNFDSLKAATETHPAKKIIN